MVSGESSISNTCSTLAPFLRLSSTTTSITTTNTTTPANAPATIAVKDDEDEVVVDGDAVGAAGVPNI